jgi:TnpA family transposase
MRQEIRRAEQLRPLYQLAARIMPHLEISNEGIKYYASLVSYYSVFRLQQFDPWMVYLYLLCFVIHRYQQCHDHLLTCFIHIVTQSIEDTKAATKEWIYAQRMERNADMPKVGQILKLFTSDQISATTPFQTVRSAAFAILDRQKLDSLADYISTKVHVDELAVQWAHVDQQASWLKRHLRPILLAVDLTATRADAPLLEAVQFLKTTFAKGRSLGQAALDSFPTQFMPVRVKRYLYAPDQSGQKRLIPDRYEVLVYRQLRNALESGDLFCRDSVRFRSFEDDLISNQDWQDKERVVGYTLVANHTPVNARIIGAHEHESHFVFDLLFNNTTDIQPNIHSTDTHGANEVNFVLLHMFNYQFAPRYKAIQEKVRTSLYGFHHPSQYGELIPKPIRKLQTELIVEEWDNLQRIFVSLARKTTTQSIIVGKLSAYVRRNKTRQALWEYDNIIRSLYLLEYIDSPPLRQNVQRALNRGENYHQLRRAVSYANFGKLRFKTEDEQQLWNECCRLITNCIIYYNASILSRLLAHKEAAGDTVGVESLTQVSPVAWQHINFYGRYEFTKSPAPIDLDAIVEALAQRPIVPTPEEA